METGKHLVVYIDGSCEPVNPNGTMGMGVLIYEVTNFKTYAFGMDFRTSYDSCKCIEKTSERIKKGEHGFHTTTNNIAEYIALYLALQSIRDHEVNDATIFSDSQMLVRQMNGEWQIKKGLYKQQAHDCMEMLTELRTTKNIRIEWIPRELNTRADALSK